ncbi:hypothetical protein MTR67_025430 [Solanum verrucosum]|uniref:MULE transposase domain-containing protein n=1 Tax=Solanum verrucosum TaxID=315347 RepID=A0AAF0R060_SOLVR|nr:hypothetical protein MTR67_025430 [Solanum verrucosum]
MKSTVRMYNIAKGTKFLCDQSKGNNWKVICKKNMSEYGTHLYDKYDIKLLIVVTIDANKNVLPLAYALVARESFESWSWFLALLWKHVVGAQKNWPYL